MLRYGIQYYSVECISHFFGFPFTTFLCLGACQFEQAWTPIIGILCGTTSGADELRRAGKASCKVKRSTQAMECIWI